MEFDIDALGLRADYFVFAQTGWWEPFCPDTSCSWEKHTTVVVCCDCVNTCDKWSTTKWMGHTSGQGTLLLSSFLPHRNWCQSSFC
jgi:hypothetical protein